MPIAQLNPEWDIQLTPPFFPSADKKLYVLLEPTLWPEWEESLSDSEAVPLFAKTRFAAVGNGPVVVEIPDKQKLETVQSHLEATPSGCLIVAVSSIDIESLATSLRNRLVVQYGQAQAMMRFYEPRKLVMLIGSMNTYQRQQFFPLLTRIQWFDREWLSASWQKPEQSQTIPQIWDLTEQQIQTMNLLSDYWQGANA
ncbi:DUF4123 domain-containing protein [Vibrio japonicus]|uniref:DUF4123 domain-containing protein n=1 Tax=Vibrio japonicus TaxID=1824638 RepID=A0ABY5LLE7_9VIBR|nr:DUF4123 domain-containing protein [Vibrio japonicus]UUM31658.1 DUF4123 domain-containing protein [Vibrio japonicus]